MAKSFAFPSSLTSGRAGLTQRDYFAAAALTGLLAGDPTVGAPYDFCEMAYEMADAMLDQQRNPGRHGY